MKNAKAVNGSDGAILPPRYARSPQIFASYGLSKGSLYNLEDRGLIKSVLLKITGEKSGCRLWDVESIDRFIQSQIGATSQKAVVE